MKFTLLTSLPILCTALVAGACTAGAGSSSDGLGSGGAASGSGGADASGGNGTTNDTTTSGQFMDNASSGSSGTCASGPNDDADMDGFTGAQGDCNDCDPNVNPGAIEVLTADGTGGGGGAVPADEDCDGQIDNVPMPCDSGIAIDTSAPMDAARAIELCHQATSPTDWGVVSANWVRANGTVLNTASLQMGVLPKFGNNVVPRGGATMLGLSSGHARDASQPGACGTYSCSGYGAGTAPPNFPQDVPSCPGETDINDDVGLEVELRAPTNATGFSFDFRFYSFEYPEWVCDYYNDQFIALVNPAPVGSINGNVSFDSQNNPVSVNVGYFDVCSGCTQGTGDLSGTGFDTWDDAGATVWLRSTSPIAGGDVVKIRYAIWDTGDQSWDSTALVDNFQWIANGGTVVVGTQPPQ